MHPRLPTFLKVYRLFVNMIAVEKVGSRGCAVLLPLDMIIETKAL